MSYKNNEAARKYRQTHKTKIQKYNEKYNNAHRVEIRSKARKLYAERKQQNVCTKCGKPIVFGMSKCLYHLDINRRSSRRTSSSTDFKEVKNIKNKLRKDKLKSENKCVGCGMPLNIESRMGIRCLSCYTRDNY
jgi:hypothetical protein